MNSPRSFAFDDFCYSLALDGGTVVAGAPYDDSVAYDRGAAYVFDLRPQLTLMATAPGLATLSWAPMFPLGAALQYTDSLARTNWLPAPSGATNPVTIATTNAARFYRVAMP